MPTDDDDDGAGIAWTLVALGGGAALLWLLFRGGGGGGKGQGGSGSDSGNKDSRSGAPDDPALCIALYDDDRILLDGTPADLATTIAAARVAGHARHYIRDDARHGACSDVLRALTSAGVKVAIAVPEDRAGGVRAPLADPAEGNDHRRRICGVPPYDKYPSRLVERLEKARP
jgi:hypothetical protein